MRNGRQEAKNIPHSQTQGSKIIPQEQRRTGLESYDLDADSEPPTVRGTEIDPDYSLEYRVIFDRNGDLPETIVTLSPDGSREVNKPY